ncbi:MAG: rod shape-determining protein MreC [Candidatus Shapirobacteria bacterium]
MRKSLVILLGISLLLWILDGRGFLDFIHDFFSKATENARQESVALSQKVPGEKKEAEIEALNLKISQLTEENQSCRRLLGADLSPKLKFIPAQILGVNKEGFVLNVGSFQGLQEGSLILWENILVGKITKVNSFSSEAISIANKDFQLAVGIWRVADENKPLTGKGILRGGPALVVEEILADELVETGDLVASLESGGEFLIGRVSAADWEEGKYFKRAAVDWLIDWKTLRTVMVVKI